MEIWPTHQHCCAFLTSQGLFDSTVIWFGLQNAPMMFQCFMNHILHEEMVRGHVLTYVNDVIVFMESLSTH